MAPSNGQIVRAKRYDLSGLLGAACVEFSGNLDMDFCPDGEDRLEGGASPR